MLKILASGDVAQTFNLRDMSGISIRTSWKDLVAFYDVEFKELQKSRYINSLSSLTLLTIRDHFNIQTKEKKKRKA